MINEKHQSEQNTNIKNQTNQIEYIYGTSYFKLQYSHTYNVCICSTFFWYYTNFYVSRYFHITEESDCLFFYLNPKAKEAKITVSTAATKTTTTSTPNGKVQKRLLCKANKEMIGAVYMYDIFLGDCKLYSVYSVYTVLYK